MLRGTFAIALWDEKVQRLLLAIDRVGVQPLYWSLTGGNLFFSSRSSSIVAAQDRPANVNAVALVQFLILSCVPAPMSIYGSVERLRPGYYLTYEGGQVRQHRYWDMVYKEEREGRIPYWANEVRGALRKAVRDSAEGCAPERTGAYLSGGTDSSTVVAFLDEFRHPTSSFSVWFDDPRYSEIGFARTTADAFRTHHFERCVTAADAEEVIPKILDYYDEPFANSSALGAYWCARMAQEQGMEILLAGDGGDELFAGNERYAADIIFQLYHGLPRWMRHKWIEPLVSLLPESNRARRFVQRARIPNPHRMLSRMLFLRMSSNQIFDRDFLEAAPREQWLDILETHFATVSAKAELNRLMYLDLKITLADNDLRKVVGTAELAGMRVRFPLLNQELVEFSGRIPTHLKMRGWQKRYIFKQAMKGLLPERVLNKKKHGFGVPLGKWLLHNSRLNALVMDVLCDSRTRQRGYFRPAFLDQLIELHRGEDPAYYGELLWYVVVLEFWHRIHLERAIRVPVAN
jgi:asparagine synthase (glutamine-hydrolysing)